MKKIIYICKRILKMDYKNMIKTARAISKKANRNFFAIFFDIIRCGFKYQAGYEDYRKYEFYLLTKEERKTFLTRGKNNEIIRRFNDKDSLYKFEDKVVFNKLFNKYLKRNWMVIDGSNSKEFTEFLKANKKVIIKPIDSDNGKGIEQLVYEENKSYEDIYNRLFSNKQLLIEEWLTQHPDLDKLCNTSVNTMRMFTFCKDGTPHFIQASLKIGKGSVADNLALRRHVHLLR